MDDLIFPLAGLVSDILAGLEGRGSRIELKGPSLYEFIDDLIRTFRGSGVERIDDHTLGLRDAVMVFEVIEEAPEHVTGTPLEELERRGVHVVVPGGPGSVMISFNGTGDDGGTFQGRIVPSRAWAFLISSSNEDAAAELVQMVDERLRTLDERLRTLDEADG